MSTLYPTTRAFHFVLAWLRWFGMQHSVNRAFNRRSDPSDLFGTDEVDAYECNAKVEYGEGKVDAKGVPAVCFDEMFQALRESCIGRQGR
jgi:hypothetical protein